MSGQAGGNEQSDGGKRGGRAGSAMWILPIALVALGAVVIYLVRRVSQVERQIARINREARHGLRPEELPRAVAYYLDRNPGAIADACGPYLDRAAVARATSSSVSGHDPGWGMQCMPQPPRPWWTTVAVDSEGAGDDGGHDPDRIGMPAGPPPPPPPPPSPGADSASAAGGPYARPSQSRGPVQHASAYRLGHGFDARPVSPPRPPPPSPSPSLSATKGTDLAPLPAMPRASGGIRSVSPRSRGSSGAADPYATSRSGHGIRGEGGVRANEADPEADHHRRHRCHPFRDHHRHRHASRSAQKRSGDARRTPSSPSPGSRSGGVPSRVPGASPASGPRDAPPRVRCDGNVCTPCEDDDDDAAEAGDGGAPEGHQDGRGDGPTENGTRADAGPARAPAGVTGGTLSATASDAQRSGTPEEKKERVTDDGFIAFDAGAVHEERSPADGPCESGEDDESDHDRDCDRKEKAAHADENEDHEGEADGRVTVPSPRYDQQQRHRPHRHRQHHHHYHHHHGPRCDQSHHEDEDEEEDRDDESWPMPQGVVGWGGAAWPPAFAPLADATADGPLFIAPEDGAGPFPVAAFGPVGLAFVSRSGSHPGETGPPESGSGGDLEGMLFGTLQALMHGDNEMPRARPTAAVAPDVPRITEEPDCIGPEEEKDTEEEGKTAEGKSLEPAADADVSAVAAGSSE